MTLQCYLDVRNAALRQNVFSFDQPMFSVIYGESNCGKTSLIETLMTSMFTHPKIVIETRHSLSLEAT